MGAGKRLVLTDRNRNIRRDAAHQFRQLFSVRIAVTVRNADALFGPVDPFLLVLFDDGFDGRLPPADLGARNDMTAAGPSGWEGRQSRSGGN